MKPFARPLTSRLRAYVNRPIHAELQELRDRTDHRFDVAARELEVSRQEHQQFIERSLAGQTLQVLQEIQASRESLRRSLMGALVNAGQDTNQRVDTAARELDVLRRAQQQFTEQSLAPHSLHVLTEIQDSIESLRQSVSGAPTGEGRQETFAAQLERIESFCYAAARRVAIPCGHGEVMVRTMVGYVLCDASDYAVIASLVEAGELEPGTRLLIQKLLRPQDTFVDVGANVGMHTLAAAGAMQRDGHIVTFEPFPRTHELLRKTLWMNGISHIVEMHQAAAADVAGHRQLFLGLTSGHHSLFPLHASELEPGQPVDVPVLRVDDVLLPTTRVDLIKIDAEGAELEVLQGAGSTISRNRNIGLIVEFGASHLVRTGRSTADWLQQFESKGLCWGVVDAQTGEVRDATVHDIESADSVNLFISRPGSTAWDRARGRA